MKNCGWVAILFAAVSVCLAQGPAPAGSEVKPADDKARAVAEAKAKQNARRFQNNATIITFVDRYGKQTGKVGEKALYDETVLSPDGKRIAVIKEDLPNESADLFILDLETGASTRLTTSAKTEFVMGPVWSPDSKRIAYTPPFVAARRGSIFVPRTARDRRNRSTRIPARSMISRIGQPMAVSWPLRSPT